ncbi:MAG: response regulator [Clostridiales bacterium]
MTRILIIDDEALIRIGLKSIISWNDLDCEFVGEAKNGVKGLELIEELMPDIVITDLKMPLMDGISLIRKVINKSLKVKFIVLSNFDDFAFVKEAMKLGVEEYLIKLEMKPDLLEKTIRLVQEKIRKEDQKNKKIQKLNRQFALNSELAKKNFFIKLIKQAFSNEIEVLDSCNDLELKIEKNIICIVVKIWYYDKGVYKDGSDIAFLNLCTENILSEIANFYFKSYIVNIKDRIYAIISSTDTLSDTDKKENIVIMSKRINNTLNSYINIKSSVGVSNWFEKLIHLKSAYYEALNVLEKSFFYEKSSIYFYNNIEYKIEKVNIEKELNLVKLAIEFYNIKDLKYALNKITNKLISVNISENKAKDLCCQLFYKIKEIVVEYEIPIKKDYLSNKIYEVIDSKNTLGEIIVLIEDFYDSLAEYFLDSKNLSQPDYVLKKVKRYIEIHITEDIKLSDLSNLVYMSNSYFSTFFKKHTGECFSDYISKEKIIRAKKLLDLNNYKIYEISHMLGYENAYYFSRVFKKLVGRSPKEYRKR